MPKSYNELSARKLREMLLNNTLKANLMSLENYEKLFGYEINLDEPDVVVLNFCTKGLDGFAEYNIDIQKTSLEEIIKRGRAKKKAERKKSVIYRVIRNTAAVFIITAATALLAQGVSYAFGFDLFGYIYHWFKPNAVEITTVESRDDGSFDMPSLNRTGTEDGENKYEFIFYEYNSIDEIDKERLNLISPWLISEYVFKDASYMSYGGEKKLEIHFFDKNENEISLLVQNLSLVYREKADEVFVKEIAVNDIIFTVFKNTEDYQVLWDYGGYLHTLNALLPLEEVEKIIRNYY